eukprot:TRINITY_DN43696_c0_g1_i2.p1 TRINITY_DN43696_c0_g1~~TRINITY_DN43696_c0_g1_i2.p1  ORF type:complete len:473 (+),score=230.68 TRINITY_DN43696_c0_g1_i2:254-1672(+)
MVDSAMFDAVAAYNRDFTPTLGRNVPLRPKNEHNDANRAKALSYAAYRVLQHFYGAYTAQFGVTTAFFTSLGYNPSLTYEDTQTPIGIGNLIGRLIVEDRANDGANEYANEPGTKEGAGPYSDYTNYTPVNPAQTNPERTNCSALRDINHWQPLFNLFNGIPITQSYSGAEFGLVRPFAMKSGFEFTGTGPALLGTNTHDECLRQINEVLQTSANLGDFEKVTAEWWGLIDYSELAVDLAARKNMDLVETVKFVFLHGMTELDGGIAAWALKRLYDSARPITYIQCLYEGVQVQAYGGPYQGKQTIDGNTWQPYPFYDRIIGSFYRTPPFADYVSGHATSAGAVAEAYKLYFGSDVYNRTIVVPAGSSLVEPRIVAGQPGHVAGVTDVPNSGPGTPGYSPAQDVTLQFNTFTDMANSAGLSRMYLGVHLQGSNVNGINAGRYAAGKVYQKWLTLTTRPRGNGNGNNADDGDY